MALRSRVDRYTKFLLAPPPTLFLNFCPIIKRTISSVPFRVASLASLLKYVGPRHSVACLWLEIISTLHCRVRRVDDLELLLSLSRCGVVSLFALGLTLTWFTYHAIPLPLQMLTMTERHLSIWTEIHLGHRLCFCYLLVSRSPRMAFVGPFENLSLTLGSRSSYERGILITASSYRTMGGLRK